MTMKYTSLLLSFALLLASNRVLATKDCNNIELCYQGHTMLETNQTKCEELADMIFLGQVKKHEDSTVATIVEKIEKGEKKDLKTTTFKIGCLAGEDLSALLGNVKKSKGPKFRFYLKKSLKEESGYRIIHYMNL